MPYNDSDICFCQKNWMTSITSSKYPKKKNKKKNAIKRTSGPLATDQLENVLKLYTVAKVKKLENFCRKKYF